MISFSVDFKFVDICFDFCSHFLVSFSVLKNIGKEINLSAFRMNSYFTVNSRYLEVEGTL